MLPRTIFCFGVVTRLNSCSKPRRHCLAVYRFPFGVPSNDDLRDDQKVGFDPIDTVQWRTGAIGHRPPTL